jgi:hypothetical protein
MSKKLTEQEKQDKLMEIIKEQRVLIDSLMDNLRRTKSALDLIVANSKLNENANIKLIK